MKYMEGCAQVIHGHDAIDGGHIVTDLGVHGLDPPFIPRDSSAVLGP